MTRNIPSLILAALLTFGFGCAEDEETTEPMTERVSELAAAVDVLVAQLGDHYAEVLAADEMPQIIMLEAQHYQHTMGALAGISLWLEQLRGCADDAGHHPDIAHFDTTLGDVERATAMHRIVMAFADDASVAEAAESRYQAAMMGTVGEMRGNHLYMQQVAVLYNCAPLDLQAPPPYLSDSDLLNQNAIRAFVPSTTLNRPQFPSGKISEMAHAPDLSYSDIIEPADRRE